MQELRFVLIIIGIVAIAALLFHGLWASKKEGKTRFADKPLEKLNSNDDSALLSGSDELAEGNDDFEIVRKGKASSRHHDAFDIEGPQADPLIDDIPAGPDLSTQIEEVLEEEYQEAQPTADIQTASEDFAEKVEQSTENEDDLEVIVISVHCTGNHPFVGTELFDSMQQNGLIYGEMSIYHRHADLSGTGKVLFSVANMLQPGTLAHDDPDTFTTKGISFFMTLPCYGDPEQNFKLMLKTAQQIADDLGGNVLDDKRNLMTPDRLDQYRQQIAHFKASHA